MAFKSVKKQFNKVKEQMEEEKSKGGGPDWAFKPQMVQGEEETVFKIRFLPIPESTSGKPWVEVRYHMFEREGDNQYVKAIDPRSFDKNAANPISDLVKKLYASDNSLDQEQAGNMRSKARYFTLVYVKEAPENQKQYEGKVLIYEAGVQVFRKMEAAINKLDMCFWDPFEGTDFLLTLKETGNAKRKWPSYLESDFVRKDGPIVDDEEEMERISEQVEKYDIKKLIIDRDGIKSGDELREMMEGGLTGGEKRTRREEPAEDLTSGDSVDIDSDDDPDFGEVEEPKKSTPKKAEAESEDSGDEVTADIGDLDVDFSDTDFNLD
jgi:hypothetical protein